MQLGSSNLIQKCSTMSLGNPFILGSKGQEVKVTGHKNIVGMGHGARVITFTCQSCLFYVKFPGYGM